MRRLLLLAALLSSCFRRAYTSFMTPLLLALLVAAAPAPDGPSRARGDMAALISNHDYPAEALRNDEEGTVRVRLHVGADGRVSACTVSQSSGSASLDSTTCRLLQERARFTPARDSAGRVVSDTVATSITWNIEHADPATPEVEAAFAAYMTCLMPHFARGFIDTLIPLQSLAGEAFAACRAEEDALLAFADAMPAAPAAPAPSLDARDSMRGAVLEALEQGRNRREP